MFKKKKKRETKEREEYLKYSFINNSILLSMATINKNGFYEMWRQENEQYSIQILCINLETGEFQAFDRFHWMDEPRIVVNPPAWFEKDGVLIHCDPLEEAGTYYNKDLWTPIQLHYTMSWLKDCLASWRENMNIRVNGTEITLNDELCEKFKEKVLYEITENECRMYAEAFFEKNFDAIINLYPKSSIEKVIENAMQKECEL